MSHRTRPGRRVTLVTGLLACAGLAAGCSAGGEGSTPRPSGSSVQASIATGPASAPTVVAAGSDRDQVAAGIAQLERSSGARLQVAVTPVGRSGAVWVSGHPGSQVAWSTAKVPVAVAVVRTPAGRTARAQALMRSAITASDNDAADSLFALLGSPARAAQATQAVVREAGDRSTVVPATRRRAGYSIFGQTVWPAAQQARFLGDLACRSDARPVLQLMGQVRSDQRWGLGGVAGARIKGGWGPATSGSYEVRQMGLVTIGRRQVAVAMTADHTSFEQGTQLMTQLATLLQRHPGALPSGHC